MSNAFIAPLATSRHELNLKGENSRFSKNEIGSWKWRVLLGLSNDSRLGLKVIN